MRLTGKTIAYFVCLIIISSIGFGMIIYDSMHTSEDITNVYKEEIPRLLLGIEIRKNVLTEVANVRAYFILQDEKFITAYKEASDNSAKITEELLKMSRTDLGKKTLQEISTLDRQYSQIVETQVFPKIKAGDMTGAQEAMVQSASVAAALMDKIGVITDDRNAAVNNSLKDAIASADNTIMIATAAAIISLIAGILIAIYSARKIVGPVGSLAELARKIADGNLTQSYSKPITQDEIGELASAINAMVNNLKHMIGQINHQSQQVAASSEQLTASADQSAQASNQVAGSITEVAEGTEKQLAAVKTANAVAENMVAELEEVAANVTMVADKAVKTAETATTGGKSAARAINQMQELEKTVSDSAAVVAQLGERSKEIGQIVDTISGIAGQTNLLALNAAIEAARAGEQGRGFAVVAEEVRKLAEQSQEAAKRIADLIGEIQNETGRAVAAMDNGTREVKIGAEVVNETGLSFQEIVTLVDQVSEQVKDIAGVVQHVADGSEKIMSSVENINKLSTASVDEIQTVSAATEEQSASMQEIASASQNLAHMAQDMQGIVAKFRL